MCSLPRKRNNVETRECGKLNYSMYGTRDVVQNWAKEYAEMLIAIAFTQGKASPCVFHHKARAIRTFAHGGDYVSTAQPQQLKWLKESLEHTYQIKTQWFGPGKEYVKKCAL